MKNRFLFILLTAVLTVSAMTGCQTQTMGQDLRSAGHAVAGAAESLGEAVTRGAETAASSAKPALTAEEARDIALKHAGFTADQVSHLRTEYEIDHGVAQYEVEFRHGIREYDYEIHADTGEVLSFEMDQ